MPRLSNPFHSAKQGLPYSAAQLSRCLGGTGTANVSGNYTGRCPAHDDHRFSLSLKDGAFGLLAKCFAGCSSQDIRAALLAMVNAGACDHPSPAARTDIARVDLLAIAARIWHESVPITGTLAEAYLRHRAITIPLPNTLRFHPHLYHNETGISAPAMVALVQDMHGELVAIHRTWLANDGSGKADLLPVRKSLCPIAGHAVRLGGPENRIIVGEGIETVLSAVQLWPAFGGWSALSWSGLDSVVLPDTITEAMVCGDNDPIGRKAAINLRDRLLREFPHRQVIGRFPGNGLNDFNDVLRAKRAA